VCTSTASIPILHLKRFHNNLLALPRLYNATLHAYPPLPPHHMCVDKHFVTCLSMCVPHNVLLYIRTNTYTHTHTHTHVRTQSHTHTCARNPMCWCLNAGHPLCAKDPLACVIKRRNRCTLGLECA
jgi:hypothetical protein